MTSLPRLPMSSLRLLAATQDSISDIEAGAFLIRRRSGPVAKTWDRTSGFAQASRGQGNR